MKIINLIENTKGCKGCLAEHGLSFYVETEGHRLVIDAGATDAFLENAERLGVNVRETDLMILSHGHYDHAGGIPELVKINPDIRILMQKPAVEEYYHQKDDTFRYIGIPQSIRELVQAELLTGDRKIDEGIFLFSGVKGRELWPAGNKELKVKRGEDYFQDEFDHEQYLVLEEKGKRVLFSGCAHNGILNILGRYREIFGKDPDAVISGFHMQKRSGYTEEDTELIRKTGMELKKYKTMFYTGHCTGEIPYQILKECMGKQLSYVHSGDEVHLLW